MKLSAKLITRWHDRTHRDLVRPMQQGLRRGAALVRAIARNSIRSRKGATSPPGDQPYSQTGFLKRHILFGELDPYTYAVGPAATKPDLIPAVLEHGGTSRIKVRRRDKSVVRMTVDIEARPYMAPALEKARPKLLPIITGNA